MAGTTHSLCTVFKINYAFCMLSIGTGRVAHAMPLIAKCHLSTAFHDERSERHESSQSRIPNPYMSPSGMATGAPAPGAAMPTAMLPTSLERYDLYTDISFSYFASYGMARPFRLGQCLIWSSVS